MKKPVKIGVLALQGGFAEHISHLHSLNVETFEIRKKSDLSQDMSGLILPGGESTVIGKLLNELDIFDELKARITNGLPTFGTCAGMILLARVVNASPAATQHPLGEGEISPAGGGVPQGRGWETSYFNAIDIAVKRNAYGRQLGSFFTEAEFEGIGKIPMTFIRAPYIESAGKNVKILSTVDNNIVAAQENNVLVTSYHPELTRDNRVHKYFIDTIV